MPFKASFHFVAARDISVLLTHLVDFCRTEGRTEVRRKTGKIPWIPDEETKVANEGMA